MQKTIFTIIFVILLLGAFGFFLFFQEKPIWDIGYKIGNDTTPNTFTEQQLLIEKENKKNMDFYNSALKNLNPNLCEWITKKIQQQECRDMIGATQAKKSGDIAACDTLTGTGIVILCRDAIRSDRAVTTRNKILCDKVTDTERKIYCKEQIDELILQANAEENSLTKDLCNKLGEEQKWNCLNEIQQIDETNIYKEATSKNDEKLCKTIKNKELQSTCIDTISIKIAVSTNNSILCEKISDQEKRLYCKTQVSKTEDINLYKSAIESNNLSTCEKINTLTLKNKCNDSIIISRVKIEKNPSLCSWLSNTGIIASCQQI